MINNKEILFKGLKKSPILFVFSILFILFLTSLFLILTPIGWIILAGFCDAFTNRNLLQKIVTLMIIVIYISGILTLTNTICINLQD
uniref:Uncharacterized protein n=1 Tax=Caudovirales sp. ctBpc6 TaxID=2827631 RepID=A0A8S5TLG6_9CAUD|nr:MAG TPA: hypothetical protein [Caudovirales sp. ctBpc6]